MSNRENRTLMRKLKLTVVLRNDSPMFYANDSPTYRTVTIHLTPGQLEELTLRETHMNGGEHFYEEISRAILEDHQP